LTLRERLGAFPSFGLTQKNWASALDAAIRIHLMHVGIRQSGGGLFKPQLGWFNDERALWLARMNGGDQSVILV